jgi:hypothetical protein
VAAQQHASAARRLAMLAPAAERGRWADKGVLEYERNEDLRAGRRSWRLVVVPA